MHLVFGAFPEADGAAALTGSSGKIAVIGLGNSYRRDDGVGVAVASALDCLALPGVHVEQGAAEPMSLLEAWTDAELAVVIDAAVGTSAAVGHISRCDLNDVPVQPKGLSSHTVDIERTHALGQALGRAPRELVIFTVEIADTGHGIGFSPQVTRAVPKVIDMVVAEINRTRSAKRSPHTASPLLRRRC